MHSLSKSNGIVTLKNKGLQGLLLKAAWGPRRVTSKTRYGSLDSAYPSEVTAHYRLWLVWFKSSVKDWLTWNVSVAIPPSRAKKRVEVQIKNVAVSKNPTEDFNLEIEKLQKKRDVFRAEFNFEEADKIRDKILALGGVVRDTKLSKPSRRK